MHPGCWIGSRLGKARGGEKSPSLRSLHARWDRIGWFTLISDVSPEITGKRVSDSEVKVGSWGRMPMGVGVYSTCKWNDLFY